MRKTCANDLAWLWQHSINWDAVGACATIAATFVALFLPFYLTNREWKRQDRIRQQDTQVLLQERAETQQEVCSAVDCVLAYRDAAIALFESEPRYHVGIQAIRRIYDNTSILSDLIQFLLAREGLTDGSIYAAVSAKRIADAIISETGRVVELFGTADPAWPARTAKLAELDALAIMTKQRSDGVREFNKLDPSQFAQAISTKYASLADAIKAAIAADSGEPPNGLSDDYC